MSGRGAQHRDAGGAHKARSRGWFTTGLRFARAHPVRVLTSLLAIVTGTIAAVTQFDSASNIVQSYRDKYKYTHEFLEKPFKHVIPDAEIAQMSSGMAEFDLMRIDSYLGRLKDGPNWKRMCVTQTFAPHTKKEESRYLNRRFSLDPSFIDEQNLQKLSDHVGNLNLEKGEDLEIQKSSDYFSRLLKRSSVQLLSDYAGDVDKLTGPQLYILRNSIFGRHGFPFQTPKLAKLVNRRGWNRAAASSVEGASQVEQCNAFYLAERHPASELGSVGRGVLIVQPRDVSDALKAETCSCLSQPAIGIECNENAKDDLATQFHSFVDFVIRFERGERAGMAWTFLDPKDVGRADRDEFEDHADRFTAAAIDFSAKLEDFLASRGAKMDLVLASRRDDFWGVTITLPPSLLDRIPVDAMMTRDMAQAVCSSTNTLLETVGAIIPSTIEKADATYPTPLGPLTIHPRAVLIGDERRQALREFLESAYPTSAARVELDEEAIVLHGSAAPLDKTISTLSLAFDRAVAPSPAAPAQIGFSAHYLVGVDGQVYRLVDDHFVARHLAGLDLTSIGVVLEDATPPGSRPAQVDAVQVDATARLIAYLEAKYPSIKHVLNADDAKTLKGTGIWFDPNPRLDGSLPGVDPIVAAAIEAKAAATVSQDH